MTHLAEYSLPLTDLSAREQAEALTPVLSALADVNRLTLVLALSEKSMTNRELHDATDLSQALVSHHLSILRTAGLVTTTPRGRASVNALCCEQLAAPVKWLAELSTLTPQGQQDCCVPTEEQN